MKSWVIEGAKRILRRRAGLKRHEVQVGDHRWAYLDGGKEEVIIFVHGFGMEKDGWTIFLKHWSGSYRVVVPDLPGFGESTKVDTAVYDVPHQVDRLDLFIKALGITSFHLAGISMGGAIAAYYAGEHPEKVKSLFLLAPAGVISRVPSEAWCEYREKGKIALLYKNLEEFDRLLDMVFYKRPFVPRVIKRCFAREGAREIRFREGILRDLERQGIHILEGRLSRVKAPTLLIWGKNDRIVHVSGTEKFQKDLQNCRIITPERCGHAVFFDRPDVTREAYRSFLFYFMLK
ncbi:MAG: alpha/beta hydrolase [Deltaproteobacteria bacterium]|nr:alpha/beta hydrolase [Deltaproteobacteria bacterium]